MDDRYSNLSDDDLEKAFQSLNTSKSNPVLSTAMKASQDLRAAEATPQPPKDTSYGMSVPELMLAGAGGELTDLAQGLTEKAEIAFRPEGERGKAVLQDIAQRRKDRARTLEELYQNPSAVAGKFGTQALIGAAAPARLPAQMALQGGIEMARAGTPTPGGIGAELINSALRGAEGAATTGVVGLPLKWLGSGVGAATKRFTPGGQEALRLDEAARRLGVERTVGSLDPASQLNALETAMPGYTRTVENQVRAFTDAAKKVKEVPSSSGKSTTERVLEGEKVREAIEQAGNNLKDVGGSLWSNLDSYIVQNNIAPVKASNSHALLHDINNRYTPVKKGVANIDKNPIIERIAQEDTQSADLIKTLFYDPKKAPNVPFSDLHQVQAAVGKALAQAEKDAAAPGASMDVRRYKTELKNLYGSLMTDVDSWGTKNPDAQELYNQARNFWRDVVVPGAITNKVYQKTTRGTYGSGPTSYSEPKKLYSDVVGNPRAVGELFPYMDPTGRDLIETLQTMPHVSESLISGKPYQGSGVSPLSVISGMAAGSPFQLVRGVASHLPGFQSASRSAPAKKLYFARDVLEDTPAGRAAFGMAQYPQDELQGTLRRLRGASLK